jgi:hypothetical protein
MIQEVACGELLDGGHDNPSLEPYAKGNKL